MRFFTLICVVCSLCSLASARTKTEDHLKKVLTNWVGANMENVDPESELRDLWFLNHKSKYFHTYDSQGIHKLVSAIRKDDLFGPCNVYFTEGEFECVGGSYDNGKPFTSCGDLQTVKELYIRLFVCGKVAE